jgi:hypothetical protein
MMVALEVLAERGGTVVAAQAALTLRQGLQRTMESAEVQKRVAAHNAQRSHAEWQEETITEHVMEQSYEQAEAARRTAEAAVQAKG